MDLEELVMLIIVVSGFSLMVYGLITLIKNIVAKWKENYNENDVDKPKLELTKNVLDAIKLLFGAQMIGLLFYITPAINENIKIVLSLAVTLGAFVGTFLIKEKNGYNGACRSLIFIGQEFFGITMLLMMVNKGMGYSINVVFALWALFNFYIMKEFGKLENKVFFWITLGIFVCSLLGTYVDDISSIVAVVFLAVILLAIHIFNKKETLGISILSNILFVILFFVSIGAIVETYETPLVMFIITLAFVLGITVARIVDRELNAKAFLLYIPLGVTLLLVSNLEEVVVLISLFNILVAALVASPRSIFKKTMSLFVLLFLTIVVGENAASDEMVSCLIYISSVIVAYSYLITLGKKVEIAEEGGEDNE